MTGMGSPEISTWYEVKGLEGLQTLQNAAPVSSNSQQIFMAMEVDIRHERREPEQLSIR